jgi:endonuclease YncB( thermonuclease family)
VASSPPDPAAVDRFLRRRRLRRRAFGVILVLLGATVVAGNAWQQRLGGGDRARFDRRLFTVDQVLSGDTLVIRDSGGSATVRLLGVDAPDLPPDVAAAAHWSDEARQTLADRIAGKSVMLRLPPLGSRTPDGVLLAYVHVEGSPLSVNQQLIADGHAFADRRTPHPMHKHFEQAESEVRRKRKGLWKDGRDEQQPMWRQEWLRQQKREREER